MMMVGGPIWGVSIPWFAIGQRTLSKRPPSFSSTSDLVSAQLGGIFYGIDPLLCSPLEAVHVPCPSIISVRFLCTLVLHFSVHLLLPDCPRGLCIHRKQTAVSSPPLWAAYKTKTS